MTYFYGQSNILGKIKMRKLDFLAASINNYAETHITYNNFNLIENNYINYGYMLKKVRMK